MKRIALISLILLLCCSIGYTVGNKLIYFTADIPYGKGTITMRFHLNPLKSACAIGDEAYYKTCVPVDTEGELIIPDSIAYDGVNYPIRWLSRGAFQSCPNLTRIKLPSNLLSISDLAFQGCTSLRELTFPDSIKTIYPQAFIGCTALRRVRFCNYWPPRCYNDDTFDETTYSTATLVVPVEAAEYYLSHPLTHRFRYHAEIIPIYNNE